MVKTFSNFTKFFSNYEYYFPLSAKLSSYQNIILYMKLFSFLTNNALIHKILNKQRCKIRYHQVFSQTLGKGIRQRHRI
jgi:hypothetical protein